MTRAFWSFRVAGWNIAATALFGCAAVWLFIAMVRRNRDSVRCMLLEAVKLLVIAVLLLTLFRPERVTLTRTSDRPLLAVLCDASASMETRDVLVDGSPMAVRRNEWLAERRAPEFWTRLGDTCDVVIEEFGGTAGDTNEQESVSVDVAKPTGNVSATNDPGTDINLALEEAMGRHESLRAVVLLSDGDWNQGRSPVAAATKLRIKNVPVFTVAVGSDRFLPDLELKSVGAPAYALVDEHVSIPFTIQSRMPHDIKTRAVLRSSGGLEAAKEVYVPAMAEVQDTVLLVPKVEGEFDFTLGVPVAEEEAIRDNNEKTFRMSLRREILKVLVIDSVPRWEFRFLRNALSRDPGVIVRCLLLHPGLGPGGGRNYIASFPTSRKELSKYDVVFLGDIGTGPGELTKGQVEMLKGLVVQQGSGLVFLPGRRGNHVDLGPTSLSELMPVVLDESQPQGMGGVTEARLTLTTRGRGHPLTMLASSSAQNYAIWNRLPGFYWCAGVKRAKPGSDVLAVHSGVRNRYGRMPLLVTRSAGNGHVLFMGSDSAWRWRKGVEDRYHYRFWGQVVRWMAHRRHLAHSTGMRLFFTPESPRAGDRVFLHATVLDSSGAPLEGGTVVVRLMFSSGNVETMHLAAEEGGWGVYKGSFVVRGAGKLKISVQCKEVQHRVSTEVAVESCRRERVGRPARPNVLREVADITRARSGPVRGLEEIMQSIALLPEANPVETRRKPWCHPLWAGLVIVFLTLYWMGRKAIGMI